MLVAIDGKAVGLIAVADPIKESAIGALKALREERIGSAITARSSSHPRAVTPRPSIAITWCCCPTGALKPPTPLFSNLKFQTNDHNYGQRTLGTFVDDVQRKSLADTLADRLEWQTAHQP